MTHKQQLDLNTNARTFIEQIAKINQEHGMGGPLPAETFERAVQESAEAVSALVR